MKKALLFCLILPLFFACNTQGSTISSDKEIGKQDTMKMEQEKVATENKDLQLAWKGTINKTIDVMVAFQKNGELVVGSITYINTKEKIPIKLIGSVKES